jgi:hypothetical protein
MMCAAEMGIRLCFGSRDVPSDPPIPACHETSVRGRGPTAASLIKAWLSSWREWELNPVLLKELRQAVRSQILIGMLMLVLAVLFLISLLFLARQDLFPSADGQLGREVFSALLIILTLISVLFVPLYVGLRLALERRQSNFDLMFFTALAPAKIAQGKLFCGAYLLAMFFSVGAPFMVFTNLLRGVDLPTILFVLICLYAVACLAIQAAIFVACLPLQTLFEIFSGLVFVGTLFAASVGVMLVFLNLIVSGVGSRGGSFWLGFAVSIFLILGGIRLLYCMSVSLITADNRPRGYFNEVIKKEAP